MRCPGTSPLLRRATVYDNLSCNFCEKDYGHYENWFWNIYSMYDLIITVLSAEDDSVQYKIPLIFRGLGASSNAGHACAKAGLAFNPFNDADLSVIDQCFELFKEKDRKLITAAYRIGWPYMLKPEVKERYEKYVTRYIKDAVKISIEKGYDELIDVFINNNLIKKNAYPQILDAVEDPRYKKQKDLLLEYYNNL